MQTDSNTHTYHIVNTTKHFYLMLIFFDDFIDIWSVRAKMLLQTIFNKVIKKNPTSSKNVLKCLLYDMYVY